MFQTIIRGILSYNHVHSINRFLSLTNLLHINEISQWNFMDLKINRVWGMTMKKYNMARQGEETIKYFHQMINKGCKPDFIKYLLVLTACIDTKNLDAGIKIHQMIENSHDDIKYNPKLRNALINVYSNCHDIDMAEKLFFEHEKPNTAMYGAMIKAYNLNGFPQKALALYDRVKNDETFAPDARTYNSIINSCMKIGGEMGLKIGRTIHEKLLCENKAYENDPILQSALVSLYAKCGDMRKSEEIFNQIEKPNIITYTALFQGYNLANLPLKTLQLFEKMKKRENFQFDSRLYLIIINACSRTGMLKHSKWIYDELLKDKTVKFKDDIIVQNALIDAFGKGGDIQQAIEIFNKMTKRDRSSWNTMIHVFGINGRGIEAVETFWKMKEQRFSFDRLTYVNVLNACSHSGLVNDARSIFQSIEKQNIDAIIVTAMIDTLSRAFEIDEALSLLEQYERNNPAYLNMYTCILSAARIQQNTAIVEDVYERMKKRDDVTKADLYAALILVANTYASQGNYEKANELRREFVDKENLKKPPGLTWTMVDGIIHEFTAHDRRHPRTSEIYAELDKISQELKEDGHVYSSSWLTKETDDMESVLCGHSEKLAIAFNLIATPSGETIQITKNLRICGDCHEATKRLSKIRQREFIVRDITRIHHFKDGYCSCGAHF